MRNELDARPASDRETDWLDRLLLEDAAEHAAAYVDDAGFTAKVVAALPPAVAAMPRWRKPAVVAMWAMAAAGAAISLPDVAVGVGREAFRLLAAQPVTVPQIAVTLIALGLATWSAAAYALRQD